MKPISASASAVLSIFEQPAHAQVTDVCPPCPVPEPTSTLAFLTLGTLGAASTLKRKLKSSKSPDKELEKVS
ncbi:MAG: PEP-CTERM sorting domain-containing protein [Okeania sp. SIO2D1]|nr:PEP-CTERM sorting domain-containing protein [Okeania sp. SIO2D1]